MDSFHVLLSAPGQKYMVRTSTIVIVHIVNGSAPARVILPAGGVDQGAIATVAASAGYAQVLLTRPGVIRGHIPDASLHTYTIRAPGRVSLVYAGKGWLPLVLPSPALAYTTTSPYIFPGFVVPYLQYNPVILSDPVASLHLPAYKESFGIVSLQINPSPGNGDVYSSSSVPGGPLNPAKTVPANVLMITASNLVVVGLVTDGTSTNPLTVNIACQAITGVKAMAVYNFAGRALNLTGNILLNASSPKAFATVYNPSLTQQNTELSTLSGVLAAGGSVSEIDQVFNDRITITQAGGMFDAATIWQFECNTGLYASGVLTYTQYNTELSLVNNIPQTYLKQTDGVYLNGLNFQLTMGEIVIANPLYLPQTCFALQSMVYDGVTYTVAQATQKPYTYPFSGPDTPFQYLTDVLFTPCLPALSAGTVLLLFRCDPANTQFNMASTMELTDNGISLTVGSVYPNVTIQETYAWNTPVTSNVLAAMTVLDSTATVVFSETAFEFISAECNAPPLTLTNNATMTVENGTDLPLINRAMLQYVDASGGNVVQAPALLLALSPGYVWLELLNSIGGFTNVIFDNRRSEDVNITDMVVGDIKLPFQTGAGNPVTIPGNTSITLTAVIHSTDASNVNLYPFATLFPETINFFVSGDTGLFTQANVLFNDYTDFSAAYVCNSGVVARPNPFLSLSNCTVTFLPPV
jgi:hypothetical protein